MAAPDEYVWAAMTHSTPRQKSLPSTPSSSRPSSPSTTPMSEKLPVIILTESEPMVEDEANSFLPPPPPPLSASSDSPQSSPEKPERVILLYPASEAYATPPRYSLLSSPFSLRGGTPAAVRSVALLVMVALLVWHLHSALDIPSTQVISPSNLVP